MGMKKRSVLASVVAVCAAVVGVVGPGVAQAAPTSLSEGYGVRLDPVTTKLFASDPARALAEIALGTSLPDEAYTVKAGFWFATRMAQDAARDPQGCVELHIWGGQGQAYWTGIGTISSPCPWAVPSVWREEPSGATWERGQARE